MRLLAFDTETYLIGSSGDGAFASCQAPKPVCGSFYDGQQGWLDRPDSFATQALLACGDVVWVGHNIAYDFMNMMLWYPHTIPSIFKAYDEGRVYDTGTRECLQQLMTIGGDGYKPFVSLAKLVKKYLGLDIEESKKSPDAWRLRYGTLDDKPLQSWPTEARTYALDDAKLTYQVFMAQGGMEKTWPTEHYQVQDEIALRAIGVWGLMVNQERHAALKERQTKKTKDLEAKVIKYGWIGPGSKAKLAAAVTLAHAYRCAEALAASASFAGVVIDWAVWESLVKAEGGLDLKAYLKGCVANQQCPAFITGVPQGFNLSAWVDQTVLTIPDMAMTAGGEDKKPSISVSEETLSEYYDVCKKYNLPDFKDLVEYKHEEKMLATYVDAYDCLVSHGRYSNMVATGRTACSPGHQTIPKPSKDDPDSGAYRGQFCPRPGYVYGIVDYSALELCTLAASIRYFWPNVRCVLGEFIDAGEDPHLLTASLMLNIHYDEAKRRFKSGDKDVKDARQKAKAINFGGPGGLGVTALQAYAKNNYGVLLSFEQATELRKAWASGMPEVTEVYLLEAGKQFQCRTKEEKKSKRVTSYLINGRGRAGCMFTEYCNFRFQGLAADGAKMALYWAWKESVLGWYHTRFPSVGGYGQECKDSPLRDSKTSIFVHDEIVMEHPEALAKEAEKRQEELMIAAMQSMCQNLITIRVEGHVSPTWTK
jgi:hypothetical protein